MITPAGERAAIALVEDGILQSLKSYDSAIPDGFETLDTGDLYVLPGLVDTHVHINEPGRTEWEGFETATQAAAAGGFTTLVDMPLNCLPETTTVSALTAKREAAQGKCTVDWAAWGGAVEDNQEHLLPLANAGVRGYKCFLIYPGCDGFGMIHESNLRRSMPLISKTRLPLLVHAELAEPVEEATLHLAQADWTRYQTYLSSRPDEAELRAIRLMIRLSEEFGVHVHIVHVSSASALPLIRSAKERGIAITAETCPHYLCFTAEEIADKATLYKCAPPIRTMENRDRLWSGLIDGTLDLIATDHSPCPVEMKGLDEGDFSKAWGGIASLAIAFTAVWKQAHARGIQLSTLCNWMTSRPAKLAGLKEKGSLAAGYAADFLVFDPTHAWAPKEQDLYTRHRISPYLDQTVLGHIQQTWVRGRKVYKDGAFPEAGHGWGREVPALVQE